MTSSVIVVHGGSWKNNLYEGGMKEYIPIPSCGIKYEELLAKIEVRLNKDKSIYAFDINALVQFAHGEKMKMKISNEFEWSCLTELMVAPTIFVDVCDRRKLEHSSSNGDDDDAIIHCLTAPTLHNSTGSSSLHHVGSSQWLLPGVCDQSIIVPDQIVISTEHGFSEELITGGTFCSKDRMISNVGIYHLKSFLECRTIRSDSIRYHVVCKFEERSSFSMRAKSYGNLWRIKEWIPHNCERDLRRESTLKVSSKVVADIFVPNMREDGLLFRPRDIQAQLLREFGLNLKYPAALAGRNRALKTNFGDPDKSFQVIFFFDKSFYVLTWYEIFIFVLTYDMKYIFTC